jgi:hypothetical protein
MLSNISVTFHYVSPGQMLMFDFLLYRLHRGARPPVGFSAIHSLLSKPLPSYAIKSSPVDSYVTMTTVTETL